MGKKKTKNKQFINKKTAHKFTLVHRSQRDPLQADDEAGQHVLIPTNGSEDHAKEQKRHEENIEHGIFFNDDYDYMQHLRPRGEGMLVYADGKEQASLPQTDVSFGNVKLPAGVFASTQEEDIGMLNKGVLPRGPQPDWDPEIVEALDDGVDFDDPDNLLDDDFIMKANEEYDGDDGGLAGGLFSERREPADDEDEWETDSEGGYISSDNLLSDEDEFAREETRSRFTSYSMTSSVIRRTKGLKVLDDHFERIMEEYDENEIGCIEQEEVQGVLNTNNILVNSVIDRYYEDNKRHDLSEAKDEGDDEKIEIDNEEEESEEDDKKLFAQFKVEPKEKWDCESILSTYSNIYNHPKLIKEEGILKKVELHKRTGIPLGVFNETKQSKEQSDDDSETNDEVIETVVINNIRNKDETPDERKQRKKEVKEQRKNRRAEKKANKMAFKYELKKQEKVNNNTIVQKGIKL